MTGSRARRGPRNCSAAFDRKGFAVKPSSARALWLLPAWLAALSAAAQTRLGDSCDLAVLGERSQANFMHFDNALREAVQSRNAQALAALLDFPLALNSHDSRATVASPAAWQSRFTEPFAAQLWPVLHRAVIGQQPGGLFCNANGVMYGNGEVWANPNGNAFRVNAINLPGPEAASGGPAAARTALLSCDTDKYRIVIDAAGEGGSRYRSWNKPHAPPDPPAMELAGKAADGEGTGVCFHRSWRFHNGNVTYAVSEPGCSDGSVPQGVKARLEVDIAGKLQLKAWCH
jgi:hypothetical protein